MYTYVCMHIRIWTWIDVNKNKIVVSITTKISLNGNDLVSTRVIITTRTSNSSTYGILWIEAK